MKIIHLPHKVGDYTCPINGIEDQYEWKTGQRLPDYLLFYVGVTGFAYIKQIRAEAPRMVFWGGKMGKPMHEILSEVIGYRWTCREGGGFKNTLAWSKENVDRGVPVILGQLDMFHLPYFEKFYHTPTSPYIMC